jgi:hypothetical protein
VATQSFELEPLPVDETRAALINIVTELLAPVEASSPARTTA